MTCRDDARRCFVARWPVTGPCCGSHGDPGEPPAMAGPRQARKLMRLTGTVTAGAHRRGVRRQQPGRRRSVVDALARRRTRPGAKGCAAGHAAPPDLRRTRTPRHAVDRDQSLLIRRLLDRQCRTVEAYLTCLVLIEPGQNLRPATAPLLIRVTSGRPEPTPAQDRPDAPGGSSSASSEMSVGR